MNEYIRSDKTRSNGQLPLFQVFFRLAQKTRGSFLGGAINLIYYILEKQNHIEISSHTKIGYGLFLQHAYCITINCKAVIGDNCNIHKGVTIGEVPVGKRKGVPRIGDRVWIGINSSIVGGITIGNDVLIAPNTFINVDIPSNSVVFGNPCIIKHKEKASEGYIQSPYIKG